MTGKANGSAPAAGLITPQPTPFQTLIAHEPDGRGGQLVTLTLVTVTGHCQVFIPPEAAKGLAADLVRHAQAAGSGLVLP